MFVRFSCTKTYASMAHVFISGCFFRFFYACFVFDFLFWSIMFSVNNILVSVRQHMQNWRRKWHFPPNFRNGIIWTAPFLLNIRNGIIWGGAFPKHLGLQKHLFQYSLKMPACALGLQKHLFWYSLKMPACMIILKILFSQKHCTLYLYSNGHV